MNKKLVFGAVLLGAMTLTSCVDDTESASVTAIRQAKAEQLQSLADLNKANADAALIQANAYKAAQEAIAAYNEAMKAEAEARAAYQQAMADYQAAQTEIAKDEARQRAEQAAVDLERSKADLENYKKNLAALDALYEKQLYDNMRDALEAKEKYEAAIKTEDQKTQAKLLALLQTYQEENDKLVLLRKQLNGKKLELAKYEAGLITPNEWASQQIASLNNEINNYQTWIDDNKAYIETYKTVDYTDAKAELEELSKEKVALQKAHTTAQNDQTAADTNKSDAWDILTQSKYVSAINDLSSKNNYISTPDGWQNISVSYVNNSQAPATAYQNYCAVVNKYSYNEGMVTTTYIPLYAFPEWTDKEYEYTYEGSVKKQYVSYDEYTSYYALIGDGVDKFVALAEKNVTDLTAALAEATTALTEATEAVATAQTAFDKAEANKTEYENACNKLYGEGSSDLTDEERAALNKIVNEYDHNAYWTAKNNLADAKNVESSAESTKNQIENALPSVKEYAAEIKGYVATLKAEASSVPAMLKTVNDTALAYAKAEAGYNIADNNLSVVEAKISACNNIIWAGDVNGSQIDWQIQNKERQIKEWEFQISQYEAQIAEYKKQIASAQIDQDKIVADLKADIANLEAKVLAQEKITEAAKKALDDAMAEETPAE